MIRLKKIKILQKVQQQIFILKKNQIRNLNKLEGNTKILEGQHEFLGEKRKKRRGEMSSALLRHTKATMCCHNRKWTRDTSNNMEKRSFAPHKLPKHIAHTCYFKILNSPKPI
jgi:hypothetical protein